MKYYLSSFGLHNPYIQIDFADHLVYPIAIESIQGFDLDYGMLLVGEQFIMDRAAFDFITNDSRGFLKPMILTIKKLYQEGLLELFDLSEIVEKNKQKLLQKTELLASQYTYWLQPIRDQWSILQSIRGPFVNKYGSSDKGLINSNHFTLVNAVKSITGKTAEDDINKYKKIIFSNKISFSKDDQEFIIEMIKPLICHLLIHDLARFETQSTILDWSDSTEYYDRLYKARWDRDEIEEIIPYNSRKIFNLLLPQLKPNMVDEVIKFIQDKKAVTSLRTEIINLINTGTSIDEKWLLKYQSEVIKAQLRKDKVMKKVRLGSSIAGLFLPGGSLISDLLAEGASMVVEDGIEYTINHNNFDWYYAMQNNISQ